MMMEIDSPYNGIFHPENGVWSDLIPIRWTVKVSEAGMLLEFGKAGRTQGRVPPLTVVHWLPGSE